MRPDAGFTEEPQAGEQRRDEATAAVASMVEALSGGPVVSQRPPSPQWPFAGGPGFPSLVVVTEPRSSSPVYEGDKRMWGLASPEGGPWVLPESVWRTSQLIGYQRMLSAVDAVGRAAVLALRAWALAQRGQPVNNQSARDAIAAARVAVNRLESWAKSGAVKRWGRRW